MIKWLNFHKVVFFWVNFLILGAILSGIVFPFLTEYYGRRVILTRSLLLGGIFTSICGITPYLFTLIIMIFLSGFFLTGFEITCMIYV